MNYYLLENHRVKLIDVDGKAYIGDVLLVLSPDGKSANEICFDIEVSMGFAGLI